jgi:anti-sigma factor (TIGR02949 family)
MDCRQTREFMSAFVDNEIKDEETKQKVENHIWRCATCRTEFELEKRTKQIIQSKVKLVPVPNELISTVLTQIRLLQNGYSSQLTTYSNPKVKPWVEIAFAFSILAVVLIFAVLFASIYENKMAQKDLVAKEVSGIVNHFDSISKGFIKPQIISDDPDQIRNEIISKANFSPIILEIPGFKIIGASINVPHSNSGDSKCVNLLYKSADKIICLHQAPLNQTSMHEDVKKRILKGEWIYDSIDDQSFVLWGTKNLVCCAVSNLSTEELEKVLKQTW